MVPDSNKSFKALPIDSNWLAVYLDQGWFGIAIDVALLLTLIILALAHPRGVRRATALFLVAYCLVASITETGLGDATGRRHPAARTQSSTRSHRPS